MSSSAAVNRTAQQSLSASVFYDALDRMVEQNRGGSYTQLVYTPSGDKLALMNGSTLQKGFVPLAGGAMAVYNSSGLAYYRHSDWLGSSRLSSTPSRTIYSDIAYAPFGEPYAQAGASDLSFTGMNQDTVSNLYDFPAREYGIQGRWPSPDPLGILAADLSDPQSLNQYAYVGNSPLMMTDPTGLDGMDYYDCLGSRNDCNFGWEGDFGWGTSYTLNGMDIPASLGANLLSNSDAAIQCTMCQSPGIGIDQNGMFQMVKDWMTILCQELSAGNVCVLGPQGRNYLQVINPDDIYFSTDEARAEYTLGLAGQIANPKAIAELYALSVAAGAAGAVAADVAAGPQESVLFGRFHTMAGGGFTGYLNGGAPWSEFLRIGYGWDGQTVFRISGKAVDWFLDAPEAHIDLWPPSTWLP